MKNIVLALFALIVVASCASQMGKSSKQEVVTNTQWTLADQVSGSKIPTLNIEDKRISGNGGCNNFFAEATVDAKTGTFLIGNVGSTKMACNDLKTEQNFFNLLEQANKYTVKDGYLELYKDNLLLLRFKK
ncbi:hypothetical protein GCM10010992_07560 [Cloacibacterium rupense]|uniref:DUF306 domain-containing protein n=1 Tax=Cloacibacterium rupense TaxID=517423 RepID=A0ABQ2NGZ0_9FLAO|nr:META domain-containing protein [Cloacibacterium rupense]GGP02566.1 hypothetical protein GCM10010992_07560 [Cloacibacterium rupense]